MQVKSKFPSFAKLELRKPPRLNKLQTILLITIAFLGSFAVVFYFIAPAFIKVSKLTPNPKSKFEEVLNQVPPAPTPTPTPRPLTFAEMNALYGPCVQLPTLMYHHIQTKEAAVANKQTNLTVDTDTFKNQMQYLKDKNYNVLTMESLINFFDNGTAVPKHSILLTFDDGYQDFYTDAYPVLSSLGFHSTMFLPTGLMQNPDYLTWDEVNSMNGLVLFSNHTWSHKSVLTQTATMQSEILTADVQLAEHGLNSPKVFAYPYGPDTLPAEDYLNSLGYKLAFTTRPGSTLCKQKRLDLPRIRVGNVSLSYYGF